MKDSCHAELLAAIRATAAGERHVSPVIERQMKSSDPPLELTARQLDILRLVGKGLNNADIARTLGIGRDCVKAHLKTAFARLGVASRSEAVVLAIREGLINP